MDAYERLKKAGEPGQKSSGNTSMIIAAFGFLIVMLMLTAPAAGPGHAPAVMDPGPGPVQDSIPPPFASPSPLLPMEGYRPAPGPVMVRVQAMTGLQPTPA